MLHHTIHEDDEDGVKSLAIFGDNDSFTASVIGFWDDGQQSTRVDVKFNRKLLQGLLKAIDNHLNGAWQPIDGTENGMIKITAREYYAVPAEYRSIGFLWGKRFYNIAKVPKGYTIDGYIVIDKEQVIEVPSYGADIRKQPR